MTTAAPSAALATIQPAFTDPERLGLAGFLAGYRGLTVTRHAEWARMGRPASGGAGMTAGACGVVVAGVRVGTTEWERPARLKFAA